MASRFKQIPESLLVRLWKGRAARQASFKAGAGRRLRVIYPGRVGTGAGPDFRDAVLEFEGVGLVRGDVEVHVSQKDWDAHGHGNDPRYNGVVLHVVGRGDGSSTTLRSGQRVPMVSLEALLRLPPAPRPTPGVWSLLSTHGHVPFESPAELGELLDRAWDARFLEGSRAFSDLLEEEEAEQVLYESLMEALGYRTQSLPFHVPL